MAEEGGTHDLLARRRPEPDEVTEDRRAVERSGVVRADVRVAAHPDAGRQAVRPRPRGQRELDDPPVLDASVLRRRPRARRLRLGARPGRRRRARGLLRSARRPRPGLYESGPPIPGRASASTSGAGWTGSPSFFQAANPPTRSVARGEAELLEGGGGEARRLAVRADEDQMLVEPDDVRVVEGRIGVGIDAPLEHRAGDVHRARDHAVARALVVRARVDEQCTSSAAPRGRRAARVDRVGFAPRRGGRRASFWSSPQPPSWRQSSHAPRRTTSCAATA